MREQMGWRRLAELGHGFAIAADEDGLARGFHLGKQGGKLGFGLVGIDGDHSGLIWTRLSWTNNLSSGAVVMERAANAETEAFFSHEGGAAVFDDLRFEI